MPTPPRILITAGPTHEPIDAVRYLANRSSGRMGIAIAEAAVAAGCDTHLLLGPVDVEPPLESNLSWSVTRFESTADLERLLDKHFPNCDLLIMAAAVADYRPAATLSGKLPRKGERLVLELEPTPDLVAGCVTRKRPHQRILAFALEEPDRLAARAVEKMRAKGVDAIVANPLGTMGSLVVSAAVYTADGRVFTPPGECVDKPTFGAWLIRWAQEHLF